MLFQLFRSWMWLLWLLRLVKRAQGLRMFSFYGIGQRGPLSHLRREKRSVTVSSGHLWPTLLIRSRKNCPIEVLQGLRVTPGLLLILGWGDR